MFFFILFIVFIRSIEGSKILMILPLDAISHHTIFEATAKTLGSKGHKITLITPVEMSKALPNVEWFPIEKWSDTETSESDFTQAKKKNWFSLFMKYHSYAMIGCERLYAAQKVKSIIEDTQNKGKAYDVAIVDSYLSEYALPLAAFAANHTMFLSVLNIPHWINHEFRIPYPTSTLSSFFGHFATPGNFFQRLEGTLSSWAFLLYRKIYMIPKMQSATEEYLPINTPSIEDAMKKVSLILVNDDPVMTSSRPTTPIVIKLQGIHLQKAKPLQKELEEFMQSSGEHGVILFSFGSMINTKAMPQQMRDIFITVFARLKQKVIWKYHEPIEGISSNVKIVNWVTQRDILGHSKLCLFITHGGRLSSQETVYYGVPVIGIAVYKDQMRNVARLKEVGMGEELNVRNITTDGLYNLIMKIINDNSYTQRAKEQSVIFQDKQNTPASTVIYWTEYVIRHNGASHLKNKLMDEMYLFQYLLLDVWLFVILSVSSIVFVFISIVRVFITLIRIHKMNSKLKKQ